MEMLLSICHPFQVIERWDRKTANPDLRRLIVVLQGLGINDAAEVLKQGKFEHLIVREKKHIQMSQEKSEESEKSFWEKVYNLQLASG